MSQTDTAYTTSDSAKTALTNLIDTRLALRSRFKGPSAPASPTTGMVWIDDDYAAGPPVLWAVYGYDGAAWIMEGIIDTTNNVWRSPVGAQLGGVLDANLNKITNATSGTVSGDVTNWGQVSGMVHEMVVPIRPAASAATITASVDTHVMIAPANCTILACKLLSDTSVATSDTNYYSLQLRNLTAAVNLYVASKTTQVTGGTAITLDAGYNLAGTLQNSTPAENDVLEFQITVTASPTAIARGSVVLTYKVSV